MSAHNYSDHTTENFFTACENGNLDGVLKGIDDASVNIYASKRHKSALVIFALNYKKTTPALSEALSKILNHDRVKGDKKFLSPSKHPDAINIIDLYKGKYTNKGIEPQSTDKENVIDVLATTLKGKVLTSGAKAKGLDESFMQKHKKKMLGLVGGFLLVGALSGSFSALHDNINIELPAKVAIETLSPDMPIPAITGLKNDIIKDFMGGDKGLFEQSLNRIRNNPEHDEALRNLYKHGVPVINIIEEETDSNYLSAYVPTNDAVINVDATKTDYGMTYVDDQRYVDFTVISQIHAKNFLFNQKTSSLNEDENFINDFQLNIMAIAHGHAMALVDAAKQGHLYSLKGLTQMEDFKGAIEEMNKAGICNKTDKELYDIAFASTFHARDDSHPDLHNAFKGIIETGDLDRMAILKGLLLIDGIQDFEAQKDSTKKVPELIKEMPESIKGKLKNINVSKLVNMIPFKDFIKYPVDYPKQLMATIKSLMNKNYEFVTPKENDSTIRSEMKTSLSIEKSERTIREDKAVKDSKNKTAGFNRVFTLNKFFDSKIDK